MSSSATFKLIAIPVVILLLCLASFAPAAAQPSPSAVDTDSVRFYTFIDNDLSAPVVGGDQMSHGGWRRSGPRPMVQWFIWANKPKPFLPSLLFILFFSVILWSLMPRWLQAAESPVRSKFWSSFLIGLLVIIIALTVLRVSVRSLIGWPLGIMTAGITQFALLAGLSVVVSILGQRTAALVRLASWPLVGKRLSVLRFGQLLLGALICALLLQVPPLGSLPRIGPRIVCLLAILGLGALYRTRQSSASVSAGKSID